MSRGSRFRRWQTSIRGRLLAGFVVLFILGLTASCVVTAVLVNSYLFSRATDKVRTDAGRIAALMQTGPQTVQAEQLRTLLGPPSGIVGIGGDGAILFASGAAEGSENELASSLADAGVGEVMTVEDDLVATRVPTAGLQVVDSDSGGTVAVADLVLVYDAGVNRETVLEFIAQMARVAVVALVVLVALALLVLHLGLRPLTRMAAAAEAIASGRRHERIPMSGTRSETDVLAAALNRAFDAQTQAEVRARAFAADASHELRTPLATVSGYLELYRQGGLRGAALEGALERVEDEVGRIRLLVEELGLLARLDAGRPLERVPMDLTTVVETIVEDAQVVYTGTDIRLIAPASVEFVGDEARLAQVLHNLVGNAVRHTPPGTEVWIEVVEEDGAVVISVADDGPGIDEENVPRLFDRFWRADASRSREYGGSGLGLAIVQAIVQAHGGSVEVESDIGRGTTFRVTLPHAAPATPFDA